MWMPNPTEPASQPEELSGLPDQTAAQMHRKDHMSLSQQRMNQTQAIQPTADEYHHASAGLDAHLNAPAKVLSP